MTTKQLFTGTLPFVWAKLALGGATVLICIILLAIFMGLGWLFGETAMAFMFLLWIAAVGVVRFVIMHYFGYLVKAGHVAVIAEACATGSLPDNQVAYGKAAVTSRFATANVYFGVDKLVSGAVKQIQSKIGKISDALDFIPGIEAVASLAQFFVNISLGYVDECCLGWTFAHKEESAVKGAADGVVLYAQNWKPLLKSAAMTMLKVILLTIVVALIIFIPVGLIFKLLNWSGLIAFLLALLIAWVVKFAFMDSYIMIQMMTAYMNAAASTTLSFDLYGTLCTISTKFKELWKMATGSDAQPAAEEETYSDAEPEPYTEEESGESEAPAPEEESEAPRFCHACGAKVEPGSSFCGACGAKL